MNNHEYEQKRRECWEEFMARPHENPQSLRRCFDAAFDRAYALGKQQATTFCPAAGDLSSGSQMVDPKPAEPKYRKGEKVRYNGYVYEVDGLVGKNRYTLKGLNSDLDEDMIEPYTEPGENMVESRKLSQETANCDKEFDNILKDSFSKEHRLNIATTIIGDIIKSGYYSLSEKYQEDNIDEMVKVSMQITDALIAESELTNKLKEK